MSDGQESLVTAVNASASTDGASSAITARAIAAFTQDSAGVVIDLNRGAPIVAPPPLNVPTLSVATTANAGDNVPATATVDDTDGNTTTGVSLYNGVTLIGAMTDAGSGHWTRTISGITAGTYSLIARRITAAGTVDSIPHSLVVSPPAGTGNEQVDLPTGLEQVDLTTGNIQTDN